MFKESTEFAACWQECSVGFHTPTHADINLSVSSYLPSRLFYSFTVFKVTHVPILSLFFSHFFTVCVYMLVFLHLFQVISGQLVFSVTRGSTRPVRLRLDQVQVADGQWHDLQLELRDVHSGRETRYVATLRLDFGLYQVDVIRNSKGRF